MRPRNVRLVSILSEQSVPSPFVGMCAGEETDPILPKAVVYKRGAQPEVWRGALFATVFFPALGGLQGHAAPHFVFVFLLSPGSRTSRARGLIVKALRRGAVPFCCRLFGYDIGATSYLLAQLAEPTLAGVVWASAVSESQPAS